LLMASLGHDVGHPGVNNDFMVIQNGNKYIKTIFNFLFIRLLPRHL
jgi:hypothetical protein